MNNLFIFFPFGLAVLFSCNSNQNTAKKEETGFTNPKVFFKCFESSMPGKPKLFLYATRDSSCLDGDSTIYITIDGFEEFEPLVLSGKLQSTGNFNLELSSYTGTSIINIKGAFLNDTVVNLELNNIRGINLGNLEFKEYTNNQKNNLMLTPISYYKSKLDIGPGQDSIWEIGDTCLSYLNINTFKFKGTVAKEISNIVDSFINPEHKENLDFYFRNYNPAWGHTDIRLSVFYFDEQFITLQVYLEEKGYGATHSDYEIKYLNYDKNRNKLIKMNDIFPESSLPEIENIFKQKFIELNKNNDDGVVISHFNDFHLPESFAISRKGILFQFQPGEMGSFSSGAMNLFLPYSKIGALMFKNETTKTLMEN